MQISDLNYPMNTAGSPSGFSAVSTVTGTSVFPVNIPDNSISGNFMNTSGSTSACSFYCAWKDSQNLATYLLSANNQVVGGYGVWLGATHPVYTGMYCDECKVSPFGASTGATTFPLAKLECTYAYRTFNPASPTVLREESLELSGEVISIPVPGLTVSGRPTGSPESLYYPLMRYGITIMQVMTLPLGNILTCMNTVNSTSLTMQLGGGITTTVSPGYALYEGIGQTKRTIATNGQGRWDICHTWLISPIKHNLVLNPALVTGSVNLSGKYGTTPSTWVMPDQTKYYSADHAGLLGV